MTFDEIWSMLEEQRAAKQVICYNYSATCPPIKPTDFTFSGVTTKTLTITFRPLPFQPKEQSITVTYRSIGSMFNDNFKLVGAGNA